MRSVTTPHERWPRATVVVGATVVVVLPLIVAVIALSGRRWYPVLDQVMTEIRIRDVGTRRTPLIGLPGRIGRFPDQGSHPGPLSFWALAPGYRLFGGTAWAMEAATVALQTVWIGLSLWIAQRRGGTSAVVVTAAAASVLVRGYGMSVLTQPWNPYLPLLAWIVVLLACWSVFVGDHEMLIPLAIAASFTAQTHIPYLLMSGGLGVAAVAVVLVRWWRSDERTAQRRRPPRLVIVTAALFVALWSGPIVDQVRHRPGNISRLLDHFGHPPEEPVGFAAGLRLLLRHLDVVRAIGGSVFRPEQFVRLGQAPSQSIVPGLVVLVVWIVSAVVDRRLPARVAHRSRTMLHVLVGITLVLSWISMARIFGLTWFYLTLWAWTIMTMLVIAVLWTAVAWWGARSDNGSATMTPDGVHDGTRSAARAVVLAGAIALVATTASVVVAPSTKHPEERLGTTLGALVEPTAQAIIDGVGAAVGPDGTYAVRWTDAHSFGSQGFGLVNELDRLGLDVGVYDTWRVPMTPYRVVGIENVDADLIFATGGFVDQWRADDRVIEVASVEPRSAAELVEFEQLRAVLITDLLASGLDDLVDLVDTNLFAVRIDPRLSERALTSTQEMLLLDQNAAVFVSAPGVSLG